MKASLDGVPPPAWQARKRKQPQNTHPDPRGGRKPHISYVFKTQTMLKGHGKNRVPECGGELGVPGGCRAPAQDAVGFWGDLGRMGCSHHCAITSTQSTQRTPVGISSHQHGCGCSSHPSGPALSSPTSKSLPSPCGARWGTQKVAKTHRWLLRSNHEPRVPALAGRKTSNLQLKELSFFISRTFIICYVPVGPYGGGSSQRPAPTNRPMHERTARDDGSSDSCPGQAKPFANTH